MYGGKPSGVMAAVAAARLGHTFSLVDINAHTGGVMSGGLGPTDIGNTAALHIDAMLRFGRLHP